MATESAIATQTHAAPAEQLKLNVSKIRPSADLKNDLGLDSLTETPASGSAASSGGAQAS